MIQVNKSVFGPTPLSDGLALDQHRALFVVQGNADEAAAAAVLLLEAAKCSANSVIWCGPAPVSSATLDLVVVDAPQLKRRLGTETPALVFDAWASFDPEAFCAGIGMVPAGGLVVLLVPPLAQWANHPDADFWRMLPEGFGMPGASWFLRWVADCLQSASFPVIVSATDLRLALESSPGSPQTNGRSNTHAVSRQAIARQQTLLQEIQAELTDNPRALILVSAERGRGKSSLLGHLLGSLPLAAEWRILVTGPDRHAVTGLLAAAGGSPAVFTPFDECLRLDAELLLVDEAAALPVSVLKALVMRFPRVVMASTRHGYEGSGQGLTLRFMPWCTRRGRAIRLFEGLLPMRWAENDPLESWLQSTFMLRDTDARTPPVPVRGERMTITRWTPEYLLGDPQRLRAIMRLLTLAHYRTTPSDMRDLLDGPTMRVYAMARGQTLFGVLLVSVEGPLDDPALRRGIMAGQRRPRGHLLPQALAWHCEAPECLEMRMARIVRIAVEPGCQNQGLGSVMIAGLRGLLRDEGIGYLGSSYAADPDVNRFWHRNGFEVVREGRRRDQSGGEPSRLVLARLSDAPDSLVPELASEFRLSQRAATDVAKGLFASPDERATPRWQRRMNRFVSGELSLDAAWPAVLRWWWLCGRTLADGPPREWLSSLFSVGTGLVMEGGKRAIATQLRRLLSREFRATWSGDEFQ